MITVPRLTEKDLEVFKGKKVFLYSYEYEVNALYKIFSLLNVQVIGYCIANKASQPTAKQKIKNRAKNIRYVKPSQLESMLKAQEDVVIQLVGTHKEQFEKLEENLGALAQNCSNITSGEISNSFSYLLMINELKSTLKYLWRKIRFALHQLRPRKNIKDKKSKTALAWREFQKNHATNAFLILSPPKTADLSIMNTLDLFSTQNNIGEKCVSKLNYINLWHCPHRFDWTQIEKNFNSLKVIVGLREPIAQNVSMLFHRLGANANLTTMFYSELFESYPQPNRKALVKKYEMLFQNGLDVQAYWDIYTSFYVGEKDPVKKIPYKIGLIQDFMSLFAQHVLDITDYPFDQEKGYTIVKIGGVEVFIYQLEKLNSLVPELSQWVGVPFDKLERSNAAEDKWIAESYKQAQKEIEISQEYFDKCFDEPYVKHCYSEADIEKFKARWRPHIKK